MEQLNYIYKLLSRREYSKQEIINKLKHRNLEIEKINELLSFLIKNDFQSDKRYAEQLLHSVCLNLKGPNFYYQKLFIAGVESELINISDVDWESIAISRMKKYLKIKNIEMSTNKDKIYKYLYSHGFYNKTIKYII